MEQWLRKSQLHFHLILLVSKAVEGSGSVVAKFVLSTGIDVLLYKLFVSATAAVALLLISWCTERNKLPLNANVLLRLLLSGLASCAGQICLFYGLKMTSADVATVLSCSIPIISSVIAVAFRVETIHILRYDGQSKLLGIVVASFGAAVMSLYRGPELLDSLAKDEDRSTQLGALVILLGCLGIAVSTNIHAPLLKTYRTPWTVMAGTTITSAVSSAAICVIVVEEWRLPSPGILLVIICAALFGYALVFGMIAWVLARAGLFLVVCYTSVTPVSTTILSLLFLGANLYLGSILGTLLVIGGVILFSWSDAESKKLATPVECSTQEPLI